MSSPKDITQILMLVNKGNKEALASLVPLVQDELYRLAQQFINREKRKFANKPNITLQPTFLINEAYLRLVDQSSMNVENRNHFFALAARVMRNILVEHARRRDADKRGGLWERVSLNENIVNPLDKDRNLIALNDALDLLEKSDADGSKVIELHFFGGFTFEEIAEQLNWTLDQVRYKWRLAKAKLLKDMRN